METNKKSGNAENGSNLRIVNILYSGAVINRWTHIRICLSFCVLYLCLLLIPSASYAQDYLWAKSAGGNYSDCSNSVTTDASGNVFVSG